MRPLPCRDVGHRSGGDCPQMMQPLQEPRGCLVPQALLWSSALDPQAPSGTVCCYRPKTSRAPRSKAGCGLQASSSWVQRKSTSAAVSPGRFSQASLGGDGASYRTNNRQAHPVSQTRMSILKVHATFSLITLELLRGENILLGQPLLFTGHLITTCRSAASRQNHHSRP